MMGEFSTVQKKNYKEKQLLYYLFLRKSHWPNKTKYTEPKIIDFSESNAVFQQGFPNVPEDDLHLVLK